jgi:hypothetical protein
VLKMKWQTTGPSPRVPFFFCRVARDGQDDVRQARVAKAVNCLNLQAATPAACASAVAAWTTLAALT